MTDNNSRINDEKIIPFESEITNSEFNTFKDEGFLKETEIYHGKKLLLENAESKRESYSLFGYRTVNSHFKDIITAEVEIIQSKFNFVDIVISISDGNKFHLSDLSITKQRVHEDVNGDTEYSFSVNSGKHGLFMTMIAEKDRIVISLNFIYTKQGIIRLDDLTLQAQLKIHSIRYKIHGCVERKNSGMNTKKTQYIQKLYSSLEFLDEKLSINEKNKKWKEEDQKYQIGGKREMEDFTPNIDLTKIAALSQTEIFEKLNKDQKKLLDLMKENSEYNLFLKKSEIIQDKIISTHLPKEALIEMWKDTRKKLNHVLMENKTLPSIIRRIERRIERLKQKKKEGVKSMKDMFLDELKD